MNLDATLLDPTLLDLTPLDPADRNAVDDVFELRTLVHRADTPHLPAPCLADFTGSLMVPPPATRVEEWAGRDGSGRCVASVRLEFPQEENTEAVTAAVLAVHPALRRQGAGRRLVEFVRDRAGAAQRSRILFTADSGPAGPAGDTGTAPAHHLAAAIGARPVWTLDHLRLDVADAPLPQPLPESMSVRYWGSEVPEELVEQAARLEAALSATAPTGDPGWQPQPAAISRIRDFERMRITRGRRAHQCAILDRTTGRMAAWTALSMTRANPDNALQAITIVDPAHRGLGLGRQVKAHNLARARAAEPRLAHVDTWNASGNAHMLRVNAGFGFVPAGARWAWELSTAR
ncbi:GNAT family N-acetyltransferase [Streptomyces sp. NPDC032472]|uniref:GNAT family N-acetyltransferase n=1 Tax=Streptomyces sp. NPDC032472 TaxID=3155018 RepID=UPI00340CB5AF